ncbi:unnamed protein product [Paramecium sonneborni]|uniref:Uncharacterized protein n=1 Tax=Paramecium sonneborni TaxID=65129 RepID=A0A8S1RSS2_9CILI|nr:unnamed protein product [Paramecium sonneborni]
MEYQGLGKTIMVLALIIETQKKGQHTLIVIQSQYFLSGDRNLNSFQTEILKVLAQTRSLKIKLQDYDNIQTTCAIFASDYSILTQINNLNLDQQQQQQQKILNQARNKILQKQKRKKLRKRLILQIQILINQLLIQYGSQIIRGIKS